MEIDVNKLVNRLITKNAQLELENAKLHVLVEQLQEALEKQKESKDADK